jgi:uncharacterized delta-60 repeat protein
MLNTSPLRTLVRVAATLAVMAAAGGAGLAQTKAAVAYFRWDGSPTPTFGTGGVTATDFLPATDAWAQGMVIDALGRLIVAGGNSDGHFVLACYNRYTGVLDSSFGVGGRVYTSFGSDVQAKAHAVALTPKGDIIAVGGAYRSKLSRSRFAVARYTQQGAWLDSVETGFPGDTSDVATAVAVDGNGRIVVAGTSILIVDFGGDGRIALARYDQDLNLDSTFNGDGNSDGLIVTNRQTNSDVRVREFEQANGIAFLGTHIVLAAHSVLGYPEYSWYISEFLVLRYHATGALYTGFDGDGIAVPFEAFGTTAEKTVRANAIAVDPNGKILAAGRASFNSGGPHFALVRLNGTGSPDTTFSGDGKVLTSFGWSAPSEALAVSLRSTSSIMLAGWSGTGSSRAAVVARYTSAGSLDTTFDGDGRATAQFSCTGAAKATSLAVFTGSGRFQTLPHIYVAGYGTGPCP